MKHLSGIHYEILKIMEKAMRRFEYVPIQYISKKIRIKPTKLEQIMDYMRKNKLLKKKTTEYVGYALTYRGLDALALRELGMYGAISRVGPKIGLGKEGDIWIAYLDSEPRIIKLFHISKESFRKIKVHRYYYVPARTFSWFQISYKSAYREFRALVLLHTRGVNVPKPIIRNRHVIVMEYINGRELVKTILSDPLEIFRKIIREIIKTFKAGIIHADLSEYNILVTEDGEIYLIDFPQYIPSTHPDAMKYFEKDIAQIVRYFVRKYHLSIDELERIVKEVMEEMEVV